MNPFVMLLLVFFLLGSGGAAMAIVILETGEHSELAKDTSDHYCWWC